MSLIMDENDPEIPSEPLAPTPLPAPAIRFCKGCGDPWNPEWTSCPRCAARGDRAVTHEQANADFQLDLRRVKSAVALYFSLLAVSVVSIIVLTARSAGEPVETVLMGASACMSVITLVWCIASRREILPLLAKPPQLTWLVVGALAAIPTLLLAHGAVTALHQFFAVPQLSYLDRLFREGWGWQTAVVVICLQPAIFEELGFRGVILTAMEPVIGPRQAMLVSALMFAILHLSVVSIPHLFVMGLVLAWLRQRTGSLYAGMVTHFMHNFLVLLAEKHGSILPW